MGADLILMGVPQAELTDSRRAAIRELLNKFSDRDLKDIAEFTGQLDAGDEYVTAAERRAMIMDAVEHVLGAPDRRDVSAVRFPGMDYAMLLTGGMSFGDEPSDSYAYFETVASIDELYDLLLKWAREDAAQGHKAQ